MKKLGIIIGLFLITNFLGSSVFAQYQIDGTVFYDGNPNMPMQYVTVGLYDLNDNLVAETQTDYNGNFIFTGVVQGQYNLHSTTTMSAGGIDLYDASLILMSLLNMYTLDAIQFEAADVNNDDTVNFTDYFLVVIYYLINGQPFPAGDWQFENVFVDLTSRDPGQTVNTWGVSEGDVDGGFDPTGRELAMYSTPEQLALPSQNDGITEVFIGSDYLNTISGCNLNLSFPSELIEVVGVSGPSDTEVYQVIDNENGLLKLVWMDEDRTDRLSINGEHLFTLQIRTKATLYTGQKLSFELLPEGGLINDNGIIEDVTIHLPVLLATEITPEHEMNDDLSCYPNPVSHQINFDLKSTIDNYATISIYDLQGRLVAQNEQVNVYSGNHTISMDASALQSGHYFYLIEFEGVKHQKIHGNFIKVN